LKPSCRPSRRARRRSRFRPLSSTSSLGEHIPEFASSCSFYFAIHPGP
jgi:hypothetical protein